MTIMTRRRADNRIRQDSGAKGGLFQVYKGDDTPCICGICREDQPDNQAKADHLSQDHDAIVRVVERPGGKMFEWMRR